VWEWVQDCYDDKAYAGKAPLDGKAYGVSGCEQRVLRGGSWDGNPLGLRTANRVRNTPGNRSGGTGFRLARTVF
jgi:formylglycine-generating enzyme required for sulfatase activity